MEFDDLMAKAGFNKPGQSAPEQGAQQQQQQPPAAGDPPPPAGATSSPENNGSSPAPEGGQPPVIVNEFENKFLSERLGGKFKSIDEVIERVSAYERLEKDHTDLSERSKKLIEPANEFVKAFNEAASKRIPLETFLTVQKIDQETNPINIISLANQIKYGLSPEDALWKAQRQYAAATADENERGFDPDTSREAKIQLSIDAKASKEFLEQYKSDAMMPVTQTPELLQQKIQERQNAWKPELPKVMADFKKLSFNHNVDGVDIAVDFDVPRETLAAAEKYIMEDVLSLDGVEAVVGKDNDEIKDIIRLKVIELNFDAMIKKAIADTAATLRMRELAQKHNPTGARQEQAPAGATGQGVPDKDRIIANKFLKEFPINS